MSAVSGSVFNMWLNYFELMWNPDGLAEKVSEPIHIIDYYSEPETQAETETKQE